MFICKMKTIPTLRNIVFFFLLGITFTAKAQKKDGPKKIRIQPVFLIFNNIPEDSSFNSLVKEAFTRHKVKLISKKEFDQLNDGEVLRVGSLFRTRQDQFESESQVRAAIAREQKFVTNMLTVLFLKNVDNDSVSLKGAFWDSTPYPPGMNRSESSGDKNIDLKVTYSNMREQIFAIVDEILESKWLK